MAMGEAALGAVFGELLKVILENIERAVMFKPILVCLRSTLTEIAPVIEEIGLHNNKLDRPKEELESLRRKMEEGTKLVRKCSKIHKLDFVSRIHYQKQLAALGDWLEKFFNINMQAQMARDQKETLFIISRMYSFISKFTFDSAGPSSHGPISIQPPENASQTHQVGQIGDMDSSYVQVSNALQCDYNISLDSWLSTLEQIEAANMWMDPITVIEPKYCSPHPIILEILSTVKKFGFSDEFFVKKDNHDNIIFNLEKSSFSIHNRYILFDDHKNPIVTLHRRGMTVHDRWQVYRGTSDQTPDLLFNVKKHNIIQLKTRLDVFLATNIEEKVCDFMVEGNQGDIESYIVRALPSERIIAQISKHISSRIGCFKQSVLAKVKANVDSAFIVALSIVILSLT